MESIGIRELRQHASRYLRAVEAGQTIQVTDRGRPVARLVPIEVEPLAGIDRLRSLGRVTPATRRFNDLPAPADPVVGMPLPSEALQEQRAEGA